MRQPEEWIIGEGLESPGRWYVLHLGNPMFLVEVCDEDEALPDGLAWSLPHGQVACNLVWLAEFIAPAETIDGWMFRVGEVLADYDERVARRTERDRRHLEDDDR
ncbi:MAG: hypothetical protein AABZ12_12860 [Planctomycetota bacterium]